MAELETEVMSRQCLSRRIGTIEEMGKDAQAWVAGRNSRKAAHGGPLPLLADARASLEHK
jgi:hypothetical protein